MMKRFFIPVAVACCFGISALVWADVGYFAPSWGNNQRGQCGQYSDQPAIYFPDAVVEMRGANLYDVTNVNGIACGGQHSLLLLDSGTVMAFGDNTVGQCGQGVGSWEYYEYAVGISSAQLNGVVFVAAGGNHSIAVLANGTIKAWGLNTSGQLGMGGLDVAPRYSPTTSPGISNVIRVACGANSTLALLSDGRVRGCGNNVSGQLGIGYTNAVNTSWTNALGLTNVVALAAGNSHAVAVLADGKVKVWGGNQFGQLGLGDTVNRYTPTELAGLSGVSNVACGGFHTLFLMNDGTVQVCGQNAFGQLGLGDTSNRLTPVVIPNLSNVVRVAGGENFSLAVLADTTVKSWGVNTWGQLGNAGSGAVTNRTPLPIPSLAGIEDVSCGNLHAMAMGMPTPVIEVEPSSHDYGMVEVGTTSSAVFTVYNRGFGAYYVGATAGAPWAVVETLPTAPLGHTGAGFIKVGFTPPLAIAYSNNVIVTGAFNTVWCPVTGVGWIPRFVLEWSSQPSVSYDIACSWSNQLAFGGGMLVTGIVATGVVTRYAWTNESPWTTQFYRVETRTDGLPQPSILTFRCRQ